MEDFEKALELTKLFTQVGGLLKHTMFKEADNVGITAPQGMVIGSLHHSRKMKISELSEKLGLSNSTVSGIIDRLEQQEIVERIRSTEDRRVVYVALTPKFKEIHKDLFGKARENLAKRLSKENPEDLQKITEGLNILKRILEEKDT